MKSFKKLISLLSISTAIILAGCGGGGGGGSDDTDFWAADMVSEEYYQVSASLHSEGKYCKIYVENDSSYYVNDSTINFVIDEFDTKIYPKITSKFGKESDVDRNGKIVLLILDIRDGFSGTGEYIAGYFDSTNTYSKSSSYYSNECDMIYLDCYPADPKTQGFQETVAHEFQHLVNYTQKGLDGSRQQDTWINEGLSSAAEYVYSGSHLSDRISYYNDYQDAYSYGDNFYYWKNELIDYSTVYMFFQWMRIHSVDGDAIYKDILSSSYTDYRAVVEQMRDHCSPYNGISVSRSSWIQIMTDWLIANQINLSTGKYGYKGEITGLTKMTSTNDSVGYTAAYPYEGMIQSITEGYTPSASYGSNITYLAFDSNGNIDTTSPWGDSGLSGTKYLLAINTNTDISGSSEKVYLPTSIKSDILKSYSEIEPQIYKIDILPGQTSLPVKDKQAERKRILESLK